MMKSLVVIGLGLVGVMVLLLLTSWLVILRPVFSSQGSAATSPGSRPEKLREHVVALSERWFPRDHAHPANLNHIAAYIQDHFKQTGAATTRQTYPVSGITYHNIIAELGPPSDRILVVGAHYDAAGEFPGADDNASGVAGLLELAHLLSQEKLTSRVMLVAYTLEEPPYFRSEWMGSSVHAQSLKAAGIKVKLMIGLEMIGYFTSEADTQDYPTAALKLFYPSTGHFIAVVDQLFSSEGSRLKKTMGAHIRLPVYSLNAPVSLPGIDFSDHRSYWIAGYPAVMVTDTAFYRNRAYHTAQDTADRLNYTKMGQVVDGIKHYLIQRAQEP